MLETLKIKNIAIIDSAEIQFRNGLNIISGETGAGKSIVIEAISLLLGSRAHADLIRTGSDEAVVEGLFNIDSKVKSVAVMEIKNRLLSLGFQSDVSELLIKRIVHSGGRHRIYVNGELATLGILQQLCDGLVDLCGQHEHQQLTRPLVQMGLLDQFAGLEEEAREVRELFEKLRQLREEQDLIRKSENERAQRADFLRFQLQELEEAALQSGEDSQLQLEKQLLQSAEARVQSAETVRQVLEDDESGLLSRLQFSIQKMRSLNQLDERTLPQTEALERALAECEEVSLILNRYLGAVDLNTERLEEIQSRLSLIADFRRKYGSTIDEMLKNQELISKELGGLQGSHDRLNELDEKIETLNDQFIKQCKKLSIQRKKSAETLSREVSKELKDLRMNDARFLIELESRDSTQDWNAQGADQIQFLVQTNPGEPPKPIGKIASGGELSRIMLAVRRVISDRGGIGVYLFDEIDAGIGGQTAFQVGKKLKSVAKNSQVLCITHLPQVASFADHHLAVRKGVKSGRTLTEVVELGPKERKEELARMLGGPELTKKSLENATELMEMAQL